MFFKKSEVICILMEEKSSVIVVKNILFWLLFLLASSTKMKNKSYCSISLLQESFQSSAPLSVLVQELPEKEGEISMTTQVNRVYETKR